MVERSGRPVVKIIAESLSQHDEKHVVTTPRSGIRVGGREESIVSSVVRYKEIYVLCQDQNMNALFKLKLVFSFQIKNPTRYLCWGLVSNTLSSCIVLR
jgi:hypothetical protein